MTAEEYKEKYNITIEGFDIDYVTTQEESDPCSAHQFATMINIKKLFSSFFTAVFVVVGLGGCQADTDTGQVDTEQTVQETQQITETTADQAEQIIDEIETISAETTSDLLIETETEKNNSNDGVFTIDSDVYPLDSEEINISIDMSRNIYGESKYSHIDLENLKNYPHLKRLSISTYNDAAVTIPIKLINCESTSDLNCLEEITLGIVSCDGDWLTEINSLKKLNIEWCELNWGFLHNLPQVETLILYRCDITELDFINDMKSLSELSLTNIGIEKFEIEEENNSVKRLTLRENDFTDISGIAKFCSLEYLYAEEPRLDDLDKQKKELQASLPECEINIYK